MPYPKMYRLIDALLSGAYIKPIKWEITAEEDVFQASFSDVVLQLRKSEGGHSRPLYVISIYKDGNLVEEVNDEDLDAQSPKINSYYSDLKVFYEDVRRKVMGVDNVIDTILAEIEEIPF